VGSFSLHTWGCAFLVYFVLKPFYLIENVSTKPVFVRLMGQAAVIVVVGYFAGLLFWPYALQNVLVHPLESLQVMEHYKVSIRQIFEGELMWSTQLPWYYLPKWLIISTPLFILIGFLIFLTVLFLESIGSRHNNRQLLLEGFVLFAFAFPVLYVIAIDSNLYSGIRQMLFILPPMAVLAVWGIYKLVHSLINKSTIAGYAVAFIFLVLLLMPAKHQAASFPVDYVYFNSLAGGNKKAWGNYEYDYYYHSIKEAFDYLNNLAGGNEITVAMNCNLSNYFDDQSGMYYTYTRFLERSSADWDYGLFGLNYMEPGLLKNGGWKSADQIKTFYHKGNPVAVLIKRSDNSDFNGISEIKNGNLQKGTALLEKALEKQENNIWLYVNMARAQLELGNEKEFFYYLNEGKKILSSYEPLLLLEASYYFRKKEIEKAKETLDRLLKVNPRYLPAKQLYEDVKKEIENRS
jgi:tetratricopeptide (TPR) repeat protein